MSETEEFRKRKAEDIVYVVGYARLPEGTTGKHMYNILGLGVELERTSGTVIDVSCTMAPQHGTEFLRRIIVGKKLMQDYDFITGQIRSRYIDKTRGALLAALEDIVARAKEAKLDFSN